MAESRNGQLTSSRGTDRAIESVADATAAIRETRARLDTRLAQAMEQIDVLLGVPLRPQSESTEPGLLAVGIHAIGTIRARAHAWQRAWQTGLLRKATMGGAAIGVAVALAVRAKRRLNDREDRHKRRE
jgi:hypothetical protein